MRILVLLVFVGAVSAQDAPAPRRITTDGVTVDYTGKVFRGSPPDRMDGIGLIIEGRKNVTIKGGSFRGFRCAVLVKDCENVKLIGLDVSGNFRQRLKSTPEREDSTDWLRPHDNDKQEWRQRYGAGICIENSKGCEVVECIGRGQQNGLILDRCTGAKVLDNDFSFNSGWGIALWRSSENLISQNKCDWCVRGYSHGVYDRGQDSAGILLFEQCSRNTIFRNSATHSGDGLFLYAGEETLKRTGLGGCNDNLVVYNDFSHAVANAIEATFSRNNRFIGNRCDDSNYGVWAGYSYRTLIEGNTFTNNRYAGVAIEHGSENRIVFNTFMKNAIGVHLWWDNDKTLLASKFGQRHSCKSESYLIAGNSFEGDAVGVRLVDTARVAILENHFEEVKQTLATTGACPGVQRGDEAPKDLFGTKIKEGLPSHRDVFLPADHPRGRSFIRMGEWGPLDPLRQFVTPRRLVAWEECRFRVSGEIKGYLTEGDVECDLAPGGLKVTATQDGVFPFKATVHVGDSKLPFEGVLLSAEWTVRFWNWQKDPRKEWNVPPGARIVKTRRLDYRWGANGPDSWMASNRFAMQATTRMKLSAGRYRIRTVSDDGVRVKIDGKVVQEDWTWHAPKENLSEVQLAAGEHEIVVEYFELDGHAELRFYLEPLS